MGTVAHYVEVNVPAAQAYAWWRGLTNLPTILRDTASTRWSVTGPLGSLIDGDARIVEDVPNRRIAWCSENGDGKRSGEVRFEDHGATTGVEVSLEYDPPVAEENIERAVAAFKQTIEQGAPSA